MSFGKACYYPFHQTYVSAAFALVRLWITFVLVGFIIATSSAQQRNYPILANVDSAGVWFDQIVDSRQAAIVNGPAYFISFKGLHTHPFYQTEEADRSFVKFDNDVYENVDLLYDTYGDILVLKFVTQNGALFVKLDENRVQSFDLHQHHFKRFEEGIKANVGTYFDVLFEQENFAVVARRIKIKRIEAGTADYVEDDVFYIFNNSKWIRIKGAGSFTKTLGKDRRKELTTFIRSNHINVRKRNDEDLKRVGAFCYSLKERK